MAQHDFDIDNQSAPNFRSDLNDALEALASLSSGATAPSTTYANMLWYDTINNTLKMRSEANDAWISIGYLGQAANAFRVLDDTLVVNTSGAQTGLIGDQATAAWEAGTGTTESLVSPTKVKAAIEALAPPSTNYASAYLEKTSASGNGAVSPTLEAIDIPKLKLDLSWTNVQNSGGTGDADLTLQGSQDNSTWVDIQSEELALSSGQTGSVSFSVYLDSSDGDTVYKYYRARVAGDDNFSGKLVLVAQLNSLYSVVA